MKSPIQLIRLATDVEEIDYQLINSCLQHYAAPRDVITRLLRSGDLIRIKKGLYVFGQSYAKRPYSLEVLANLVYGPSYVSCEYALSFYGMIPEAVFEVSSMTTQRIKKFSTPVARFNYYYLNLSRYNIGITQMKIAPQVFAIIATPEKALADLLFVHKVQCNSIDELATILYDSYRIDPTTMKTLRITMMEQVAKAYQQTTIDLLLALIKKEKKHG